MATDKRRKRRRLVYREHADDKIRQAWKVAVAETSPLLDWLEVRCLERVSGDTEFDRGRAEGRREAFGEIVQMILSDDEIEVKTNVEA